MSVTRYHNWCLATHRHQMMEDKAGAYVLATDYDALEAKLAESEAKLAFYDEQHAVAMETVGRLSDEVQQAQQEADIQRSLKEDSYAHQDAAMQEYFRALGLNWDTYDHKCATVVLEIDHLKQEARELATLVFEYLSCSSIGPRSAVMEKAQAILAKYGEKAP